MFRTRFTSARHGFHFTNTFVNHVGPLTTRGLCGGMVLGALRYYLHNLPIPTHTGEDFGAGRTDPPEGTRLRDYILACQIDSFGPGGLASIVNWVTAPWVTFDEQFNWSVAEYSRICEQIMRTGVPRVLGLRAREAGNPFGHQVLAIGIDEATHSLFIYDPNHPDEEWQLRLDDAGRRIVHQRSDGASASSDRYASFFDTQCNVGTAAPSYFDLGLQVGVATTTASSPPRVGQRASASITVRNFGEFPARLQALDIYTRDPMGANRDDLLGGSDGNANPLPAGGERSFARSSEHFAPVPGPWRIGASYLSQQNEWIALPAVAGGTRQEVTLEIQPEVAPPPTARSWTSMGGLLNGPPAVGINRDGRLEVYALGSDDRIWRVAQGARSEPTSFGGWELLPGETTLRGAVSAVRNHWDKVELFGRGRDGQLWHRWQNDADARPVTAWSAWTGLGGRLAADPSACVNQDQRLEVFALHDDGQIHHLYQRWFDAFGAPWSGWEVLPGPIFQGRVGALLDPAGRILVSARARDGSVSVNRQVSPGGGWSGWSALGGVVSGDPVLAHVGGGQIVVIARGLDSRLWTRSTDVAGAGWQPIGGAAMATEARAAVVGNSVGARLVARSGRDEALMATLRSPGVDGWGGWETIGAGLGSDPAAGRDPNGTAEIFALGHERELIRAGV